MQEYSDVRFSLLIFNAHTLAGVVRETLLQELTPISLPQFMLPSNVINYNLGPIPVDADLLRDSQRILRDSQRILTSPLQ